MVETCVAWMNVVNATDPTKDAAFSKEMLPDRPANSLHISTRASHVAVAVAPPVALRAYIVSPSAGLVSV